jgi:hypothetical protein
MFCSSPSALFGDLFNRAEALFDIAKFGRPQGLLDDAAGRRNSRRFALAVALHLAQAVHGFGCGFLEAGDSAVQGVSPGLRDAPLDVRVAQPAVRSCPGDPRGGRGSLYGWVT